MSEPRPRPSILAEAKRRGVGQVVLVYAAAAWLVVQGAETTFPYLGVPDRVITFVIVAALLGLPVAIALGWVYDLTPDGLRRTGPRRGSRPSDPDGSTTRRDAPRRRTGAIGAVVVATLLVLAGLALIPLRRGGGDDPVAADAAGSRAIAVLPFATRGGADVEDLGEGMVSLLSTKLDGAGDLRGLDARAILSYLDQTDAAIEGPEDGRRVAEHFGAAYFILGDLLEVGGRVRITAALYRSGGSRVEEAAVEGEPSRLFELVDDLTARLVAGLEGGPAARLRATAAVTTASLPALKSYLQGERLARTAQFSAGVQAFQDAVALDTAFALAYYRLALTAEWNLQDDLARSAAENAVRFATRLSERDRRLLDAFLVRRRGANAEAERLYRSILGAYPDEMEAWVDLNEIIFHANPLRGASFTDAREPLARTLYFDPEHSTSLIHLARIAAFEGNGPELDSLVARFLALNPEADRGFEIRALHAFGKRDEAEADRVLRELERANDLSVALAAWDVAVFARHLSGAERLTSVMAAPQRSLESRTLGYAWRAHVRVALGRWQSAMADIDTLTAINPGAGLEYEAILRVLPFAPRDDQVAAMIAARLERLDPDTIAKGLNPSVVFTAHDSLHAVLRDYLIGLYAVRAGHRDRARAAHDSLEAAELPRTAGSLGEDLARSVRAQLAWAEGDRETALAQLRGARVETWYGQTLASPLYAQVYERFARAGLLTELGRGDDALPWLEHVAELSPFELPYLPVSYLQQARIHAAAGRDREAAAAYTAFLDMWSEADPAFQAMVAQARDELSRMREDG